MLCALDVHYEEDEAVVAAVLFSDWESAHPAKVLTCRQDDVKEYRPGEFFVRELPCLLLALREFSVAPELIFVDGYVWLDDHKPGLGAKLYESLQQAIPVVGIAKSPWPGVKRLRTVRRGNALRPLWITSVGVDLCEAAAGVSRMHGPFRLPSMIRLADTLCRKPWLAC